MGGLGRKQRTEGERGREREGDLSTVIHIIIQRDFEFGLQSEPPRSCLIGRGTYLLENSMLAREVKYI